MAFDNPDYVEVVIHSYRHRFGLADGDPHYADLQRRLAALPVITVPAITLDGDADGVVPATDGTASAPKFSGRRSHHVIPHAAGGRPTVENIQLRCRAHNGYEVDLFFGPGKRRTREDVVGEARAAYGRGPRSANSFQDEYSFMKK